MTDFLKEKAVGVIIAAFIGALCLGFFIGQFRVVPNQQDIRDIKTDVNNLNKQVQAMNDTLGRMTQALEDHGIHVGSLTKYDDSPSRPDPK